MDAVRLEYRDRQRLTLADLEGEQDFRRTERDGHNLESHHFGVLRGLSVRRVGDVVRVGRGEAIDAGGRRLVLPAEVDLDAAAVDACAAQCAELAPESCGDPADGYRRVVAVALRAVSVPAASAADGGARRIDAAQLVIAAGCLKDGVFTTEPLVGSLQELPEGASVADGPPVALADLLPEDEDEDEEGGEDEDDVRARVPLRSARVVAESVRAPSGRGELRLGAGTADARLRFAVATAAPAAGDDEEEPQAPRLATRLGVATSLDVHALSATTVRGGSVLVRGEVLREEPPWSRPGRTRFLPVPAPGEDEPFPPRPWSLYRVEPGAAVPSSLRVEVAHPGEGGNPDLYQLAVGRSLDLQPGSQQPPVFKPVLRATAGGRVLVSGDVLVQRCGPRARDADGAGPSSPCDELAGGAAPAEPRVPRLVGPGLIREGAIPADREDPRFWLKAMELSRNGRLEITFNPKPILVTEGPVDAPSHHIEYGVRVSNPSTVDLSAVEVHQALVIGGKPAAELGIFAFNVVLAQGIHLDSTADRTQPAFYEDKALRTADLPPEIDVPLPDDADRLRVGILAIGVSPVGSLVYAFTGLDLPKPQE